MLRDNENDEDSEGRERDSEERRSGSSIKGFAIFPLALERRRNMLKTLPDRDDETYKLIGMIKMLKCTQK